MLWSTLQSQFGTDTKEKNQHQMMCTWVCIDMVNAAAGPAQPQQQRQQQGGVIRGSDTHPASQ
jgi:hypothetical protein